LVVVVKSNRACHYRDAYYLPPIGSVYRLEMVRKDRACMTGPGVVTGDIGFVEAHRGRKGEVALWLSHKNPKVRAFAVQFSAQLDLWIASEQRSADGRSQLRKLRYNSDGT
jgi:hypothetical protein